MTYTTLCLLGAISLTLCGVWIQWHAHDYAMGAEEAIKNRKMTGEQVLRRMVLIRRAARVLIFLGVVMLFVSLMMIVG